MYFPSATCTTTALRGRYFGGLSIFMFSMLGIVLADNLLMIFVFWELVGFSSYLLINHYHEKQSAADASKKAFIVNRVGDFGFLLGILWCYWSLGTVNLSEIGAAAEGGKVIATGIPLLLFCGAIGKSAQMPLACLAARRDGGSDAGLGADPRGDHGGGRHLHAVPDRAALCGRA
jgi:NADH:ubiquinone oxidoreductase subunit 5 (subunit L)/multisubunit Na+/H+ antiporter MnhA subunit